MLEDESPTVDMSISQSARDYPQQKTTRIVPPSLLLRLATFNVRGLVKEEKQSLLDADCTHYNLDLIALQETKA